MPLLPILDSYLFIILKDQYPSIHNLFKSFPYSFQIISDVDLKVIPKKRNFLIEFFADTTYVDCYLEILSLEDNYNNETTSLGSGDNLVDSIHNELQSLF